MNPSDTVQYLAKNYNATDLLDAFLIHEIPFRLQEFHGLNANEIKKVKDDIILKFQNDSDKLFDYDRIDSIIDEYLNN